MTDEEKAKLKAEITTELGRHLEEHYVSKKYVDGHYVPRKLFREFLTGIGEQLQEFPPIVKALQQLFEELEGRVTDLEWVTAFEERAATLQLRGNHQLAMNLRRLKAAYHKRIRNTLLTWMKTIEDRPKPPQLEESYELIVKLLKDEK